MARLVIKHHAEEPEHAVRMVREVSNSATDINGSWWSLNIITSMRISKGE